MRKLITLLAAAALVASPFAFAETGNTNDVLQQIQPGSGDGTPTTLADADSSAQPAAAASDSKPATDSTPAKPAKKHKHHLKNIASHIAKRTTIKKPLNQQPL